MAQVVALLTVLKRELKARSITYADIAERLELSEASVKRMFSSGDFALSRLDEICELAGLDFADLARGVEARDTLLMSLSVEQEKALVSDMKLLAVAVACIHHLSYEQILEAYEVTDAELIGLLTKLDRTQIIRLLPNNRIKPLVARAFTWLPQGPIQMFFYAQAQADFFRARFDGDADALLFASGRLSAASAKALKERLKKTVQEFRDAHHEDLRLPLKDRPVRSVLLAMRPFELAALKALRRHPEDPIP
jgi:transcriptional regulator with XRE-family HTH domain